MDINQHLPAPGIDTDGARASSLPFTARESATPQHADDDECGCVRLDNGECGCLDDRLARGRQTRSDSLAPPAPPR